MVSHDDVSRQLRHVAPACPTAAYLLLSFAHFNAMIITYPIELPYVAGNEQRVVPDTLFNNSGILSGPYLIGKNRFWHGGLHIHPIDRNAPIRAIADGELVAYRYDANDTSDAFFNQSTYSRSFVLLKHEAELGQTVLGTSSLVFYSLYMHLRAFQELKTGQLPGLNFIRKIIPARPLVKDGQPVFDKKKRPVIEPAREEVIEPTANGAVISGIGSARVRRGDILGYCGSIPDNLTTPSKGFHFEIFFGDNAFLKNVNKTIWGKCLLTQAQSVLNDLLTEQMFAVDTSMPLEVAPHQPEGGYYKIRMKREHYWVSEDQIAEEMVESSSLHQKGKKRIVKQFLPKTDSLIAFANNPLKNEYILPAGTVVVPWMAPWLKDEEFMKREYRGTFWIPLYVPDKDRLYWTKADDIKFTSDADWAGFQAFAETAVQNSLDGVIDDEGLLALTKPSTSETDSSVGINRIAGKNEEKISGLIASHPTEWSKTDIPVRFQRVTTDEFGAQKLTMDQFAALTKHIERIAFWEDVAGLPDSKRVWHAHPLRFIEQLAKCMWLSEAELMRIMPNTDQETFKTHRINLNKTMLQWGVTDRLEQAHYLAQGVHESAGMRLMTELPSKYASSASRYKGRGFVQITSEINYKAFNLYLNRYIRTVDVASAPEILSSDSYLSFAASCWYWRTNDVRRSARKGESEAVVDEVGRVINRGPGRRDLPEYPPLSREDRLDKFRLISKLLLK
ncbi:UNVERIFIED_ORG: putative chitinase [Herbaspirillum seropedicae]